MVESFYYDERLKNYWNPYWKGAETENGKSKSCLMNKLMIVTSAFNPRKRTFLASSLRSFMENKASNIL